MERTITAAFTGHDLVDLVNSIALRQDEDDLDVVDVAMVFVPAPFGTLSDDWMWYRAVVTFRPRRSPNPVPPA